VPLEDIRLLSVGTGFSPHVIAGDHDWGKAQWIVPLLQMLMNGMPGVADYQCEQLLGAHYLRLDVAFQQVIELDDVASIDQLLTCAEAADLGPALAWLAR
jgi:hypothetical protein